MNIYRVYYRIGGEQMSTLVQAIDADAAMRGFEVEHQDAFVEGVESK